MVLVPLTAGAGEDDDRAGGLDKDLTQSGRAREDYIRDGAADHAALTFMTRLPAGSETGSETPLQGPNELVSTRDNP